MALPMLSNPALSGIDTVDSIAAGTLGAQQLVNYDVANPTTKVAEAVTTLFSSGQAIKFASVSKNIGLTASNGNTNITNKTSGEVLAVAETSRDNGSSSTQPIESSDTSTLRVILSSEPVDDLTKNVINLVVMPRISETRSVEYDQNTPLHHPGAIMKYKSTGSRTWGISAQLISRNAEEAGQNRDYLNILRSWAMPYYGTGTAQNDKMAKYLGAPPPVITLMAYGPKMVGPVKAVLTTYSWDYPNDVDYINTVDTNGDVQAVPVIISVTLSLTETYSPAEYSAFSLQKYRDGNMGSAGAFSRANGPAPKPAAHTISANDNSNDLARIKARSQAVAVESADAAYRLSNDAARAAART